MVAMLYYIHTIHFITDQLVLRGFQLGFEMIILIEKNHVTSFFKKEKANCTQLDTG